jgi:hypothetical protein
VKLHVDLETLQLIEGPGFRNPITSLRFKRGDAAQLEVAFLDGGSTAAHIGNPLALEIQFGIKPRSRYDIGYLVHDSVWTMPAVDAENPVYQCSPSFNTVELDSALGVGSATGTELSEITLMGEITWREGAGQPTSTRTFLVIVENDVNRGTEGVPVAAEPAYPAATSIELKTAKGVANGYAPLDAGSQVPLTHLPSFLATATPEPVPNSAAMRDSSGGLMLSYLMVGDSDFNVRLSSEGLEGMHNMFVWRISAASLETASFYALPKILVSGDVVRFATTYDEFGRPDTIHNATISGETIIQSNFTMDMASQQNMRNALKIPASDPTGIPGADALVNVVTLSLSEYLDIATPNPSTLYIIV